MSGNDRQVLRAEEFGRQAARAGRSEGACPYRGHTPLVRRCADAWRRGWQAERSAIKASRERFA